MLLSKAHIFEKLQREITPLQHYKTSHENKLIDSVLGPIKHAFPNSQFPLGSIHEFISSGSEAAAATYGFISALLAAVMRNGNACIWISSSRIIFPPALGMFGIAPDKIIFIDPAKEKEILWTMEEALKCKGLSAVIGDVTELSFNASRRLQLAVEQSQVTGFIHRRNPRSLNTTASVTRWKISQLPSELAGDMPGVGFPRWNVDLMKVRNGKPGSWQIEFAAGRFRLLPGLKSIELQPQKKAG